MVVAASGAQVGGGAATTVRATVGCSKVVAATSASSRCRARNASPGVSVGSSSVWVSRGSARTATNRPSSLRGATPSSVTPGRWSAGRAAADSRTSRAPAARSTSRVPASVTPPAGHAMVVDAGRSSTAPTRSPASVTERVTSRSCPARCSATTSGRAYGSTLVSDPGRATSAFRSASHVAAGAREVPGAEVPSGCRTWYPSLMVTAVSTSAGSTRKFSGTGDRAARSTRSRSRPPLDIETPVPSPSSVPVLSRAGGSVSGHSQTTWVGTTDPGTGNQGRNVVVRPTRSAPRPSPTTRSPSASTPMISTAAVVADRPRVSTGTDRSNPIEEWADSSEVSATWVFHNVFPVRSVRPVAIRAISARFTSGRGEIRSRTDTVRMSASVVLVRLPLICSVSPGTGANGVMSSTLTSTGVVVAGGAAARAS